MAKSVQDILNLIAEQNIKMVDFKMVDINGQYRHVTIPAENFSEDTMKSGNPLFYGRIGAAGAGHYQPGNLHECR